MDSLLLRLSGRLHRPRFQWSHWLAPVLCLLCVSMARAEQPLSSVADLRYGVTLYHYYQENYLAALSELRVAEARGGIQGHKDNPKLIEGGLSLAFGMERTAGDIFNSLLTDDRPVDVRNAAWYYLAKLRYLRGDWSGAVDSLERIQGQVDPAISRELMALQINVAIHRGELEQARQRLEQNPALGSWNPYLYYNLGAAYARAKQYENAVAWFSKVAALPVSHQQPQQGEQLALYDKALTAAGYSYLSQGRHLDAIDLFKQVRRESDFSHRALLGYGWAAAERQDYERALQNWQLLSHRSLAMPSVQEAILAVPYTYEKLDAAGQALGAFKFAANAFEGEISRIDATLEALDQHSLLSLIAADPQDPTGGNWLVLSQRGELAGVATEDSVLPKAYLTELFAQNRYQGAVQELQDLWQLQNSLDEWDGKLATYREMLQQRAESRVAKEKAIAEQQLQQQQQILMVERDSLAGRLARVEGERDYLALSTGDTADLYPIVQRMEKAIARLDAAGEPTQDYQSALERYRGILLWQAAESFSGQLWQGKKNLAGLDAALAELAQNQQRLQTAVVTAPDVVPYQQRIDALATRLAKQRSDVSQTVALAEENLRQQLAGRMQAQRVRLRHYLAQARLSVARLYDAALNSRAPLSTSEPQKTDALSPRGSGGGSQAGSGGAS